MSSPHRKQLPHLSPEPTLVSPSKDVMSISSLGSLDIEGQVNRRLCGCSPITAPTFALTVPHLVN